MASSAISPVLKAETGTIAWSADKFGAINRGQIQACAYDILSYLRGRGKEDQSMTKMTYTVVELAGYEGEQDVKTFASYWNALDWIRRRAVIGWTRSTPSPVRTWSSVAAATSQLRVLQGSVTGAPGRAPRNRASRSVTMFREGCLCRLQTV
jgi:hypothetical protein